MIESCSFSAEYNHGRQFKLQGKNQRQGKLVYFRYIYFFGNTDQTWRFLDKQIKEKEVLSLMSRFWGGYKVF